jgi:hypothetical protein
MNLCIRKFQVDTLRAGRSGVRISAGATGFSLLQNVQTVSGVHPDPCSIGAEFLFRDQDGRGVMLTTHLRLCLRRVDRNKSTFTQSYYFVVQTGSESASLPVVNMAHSVLSSTGCVQGRFITCVKHYRNLCVIYFSTAIFVVYVFCH